jgi:hypothetical protein
VISKNKKPTADFNRAVGLNQVALMKSLFGSLPTRRHWLRTTTHGRAGLEVAAHMLKHQE